MYTGFDPQPMNTGAELSTWLKARRRQLGLTQAELAARAACAPVTIKKIEAGALRPSRELAALLAAALELPADAATAFVQLARGLSPPAIITPDPPILPRAVFNLPRHGAVFGRAAARAELCARITSGAARLVTLTGPGGAGKTTLAVTAAEELAVSFPDGCCFVDLAPLVDAEPVAATIARTLGLTEAPGVPVATLLVEWLQPRTILLLLDNFEHVLAAAPLVARLLTACPRLTVLATSREPLHLRGEQEVPVAPLATPAPDADLALADLAATPAVALFVARARAVQPNFALTAANHQAMAELCRRLDGLPLALELAAARSKVLAPQEMLALLQAGDEHGAMFDLLASRVRDLPDRQRTLRGAIAWSYALLEAVEQRVLCAVAVFTGGCTLASAVAVCHAVQVAAPHTVLDALTSLVEKSLLLRQEGDADRSTEPRFTMLQTIREFALAELAAAGAETAVRTAHARRLLAQASAAAHQLVTLPQLDIEIDNIRAAFAWLMLQVENEVGTEQPFTLLALQLAGALRPFWLRREYDREGRRWCERLLVAQSGQPVREQPDDPVFVAALAQVYGAAGDMAWLQTDHAAAIDCHRHCLALSRRCGDLAGAAFALNNLGVQATDIGDNAEALALLTESLHLAQQLEHGPITVAALSNLALLHLNRGDLAAALHYGEAAVAAAVVLDDDYQLAIVLLNLGDALRLQGETDRAVELLARCIELAGRTRMQMIEAVVLPVLAKIEVGRGDWLAAATHLRRALWLARQLHRPNVVAECLEVLAALLVQTGAPLTAARLYGAAEHMRTAHGHPRATVDDPEYERQVEQLRGLLAPAVLAQQWAGGHTLTLEAACAAALEATGNVPAPAGGTGSHG